MQKLQLLRTAPVRYALIFAVFSMLMMGALLAVVYGRMDAVLERHLEESVEQQIQVLRADFAQDGLESMLGLVRQHVKKSLGSPVHFLVQDSAGAALGGDLPPLNVVNGWQDIALPPVAGENHGEGLVLRGLGEWFDDDTLVLVTSDTRDLREARDLIVRAFGISLVATVIVTLSGGIGVGIVLLRRVEAMNRTARAIMQGDLTRRIPEVGPSDELGGLAEGINRMLARIEELMESFRHVSSDIAHDLRTPLGQMRQRLEACRSSSKRGIEYETVIDAAIEDIDSILKTFEAIMRITQIESGARRARFSTIDLSDVAENVVEAFGAVAEDNGQNLESRLQPGVVVRGDRELLTQMLANLIENALHHAPAGTKIALVVDRADGDPRIIVSDTGPGIPPEERTRVFRRFYQLDPSRSTSGSGLGLSLVGAVVGLHDATISLKDNDPGLKVVVSFAGKLRR